MHVHMNEHFNAYYIILKGVENFVENNNNLFLDN